MKYFAAGLGGLAMGTEIVAEANGFQHSGHSIVRIADISSRFDDLSANPLTVTANVDKVTNPYLGLCYENVGLGKYTLELAGPRSDTEPDMIYNSVESRLLSGPATIHTKGCAGGRKSFSPSSIYVACAANTGAGNAVVSVACSLLFTGTTKGGAVKEQTFTYQPKSGLDGVISNALQKATSKDFGRLTKLTVQPAAAAVANLTDVLFADTLTYLPH